MEFAEQEAIKDAYRNLAAAAGVNFDEKDTEVYLRKLIRMCIDAAFNEAGTKVNSLQAKISLINSETKAAKEEASMANGIARAIESRMLALSTDKLLTSVEGDIEKAKEEFRASCKEIANSFSSKLNPFHEATEDLMEQLSRYDVPKDTWAEPIATLINSMGYLQWQANKKSKDEEDIDSYRPRKAGRTI